MYVLQPANGFIDWNAKTVLTLVQSINQPMVAAADYPAEETQAYIVTAQSQDRSLETYIYLHLLESNRCVIYREGSAPFMGDRLEEAEGEALDFVESMGFMMDNLRFAKLPEADRQNIKEATPLFYPDLSMYEPILRQRREQEKKDAPSFEEEESDSLKEDQEPMVELSSSMLSDAEIVTDLEEVLEADEASDLFPESGVVQAASQEEVQEDTEEAVSSENEEDLAEFFEPQQGGEEIEFAQAVERKESTPENAESDDLSALAEIEESLAKELQSKETIEVDMQREMPLAPTASFGEGKGLEIKPDELQAFMRLLLTL